MIFWVVEKKLPKKFLIIVAVKMSSIGTGYDLAASTFSPDGRIFQVEYAQKAVDNMGTVLAIRCKEGVVTAVDKIIQSKLEVAVSL
jgi:20S proteasome subunit alpha 7